MAEPGPTFEEAVARLESIAGQLEGGEVKPEEALRLFEEGIKLAKHGSQRLDQAERKLESLLGDGRVVAAEGDGAPGPGRPA